MILERKRGEAMYKQDEYGVRTVYHQEQCLESETDNITVLVMNVRKDFIYLPSTLKQRQVLQYFLVMNHDSLTRTKRNSASGSHQDPVAIEVFKAQGTQDRAGRTIH